MQTLSQIRALLDERGLAPKKSLGQNFLADHNLIAKLVDASGVRAGDLVLEVGPGTGALTVELLERGCRVVACELDTGLAGLLRDTLGGAFPDRFTLIEGDCLSSKREVNPQIAGALGDDSFKLVANLPYQAATPLMLALLTRHERCSGLFVTIQREVGDRLMASPGSKAYGTISVIAQALARVERVATLPPECFWPRPDVTSVMMALRRRDDPLAAGGPAAWAALGDCVQELFASRRKQLRATLKRLGVGGVELPPGVGESSRVESLTVGQVVALTEAIGKAQAGDG